MSAHRPHSHGHDHPHGHDHRHGHGDGHGHAHHHDHGSRAGHNHPPDVEHLHSHTHGDQGREHAEELKALCASFIDGFRLAADRNSYLRIAGIPFSRQGSDGLTMHLVDAAITSNWQIGTASPAFASRELVYLPYPGGMISSRETMIFTYVSLTERRDVALTDILHHTVQHA